MRDMQGLEKPWSNLIISSALQILGFSRESNCNACIKFNSRYKAATKLAVHVYNYEYSFSKKVGQYFIFHSNLTENLTEQNLI